MATGIGKVKLTPIRQCLLILPVYQASIAYFCMRYLYDLVLLCFSASLKKTFTVLILLPFEPSLTTLWNNFMLDQLFSHIFDLSIIRKKNQQKKKKLKGVLCTKPQLKSTEANGLSQNVATKSQNINSTSNLILINCWNDATFPKNLTCLQASLWNKCRIKRSRII